MRRTFFCLIAIGMLSPMGVMARERVLCEGDNCTDNNLKVLFGDIANESSETRAAQGATLNVTVTSDVAEAAQGWSMGVAHDPSLLTITEVTTEGLTLPTEFFNTTVISVGDPAPGFVSAYVTQIFPPPGDSLDPGDNIPLVLATYTVDAALDPVDPTFLEFVDTLVPNEGSPPTATNFTISSNTRKPRTVIDGEVRGPEVVGGCDAYALYFGSDASVDNHQISGNSAVITMRNEQDSLGLSFGVAIDGSDYSFSSETLGTAADRLIENIITDIEGGSNTPTTNTATDTEGPRPITAITKGADIADVEGDFFNADLDPAVGGPGFTIGYVVDVTGTGEVIPATGDGDPCPTTEIVAISYEDIGPGDVCDANYAFAIGSTAANYQIPGDATEVPILMRNANESLGFSLAVSIDGENMAFVDDVLGAVEGREVDLIITDIDGVSQEPSATNTASGLNQEIGSIVKGAATADIADDFLTVDLNPAVGGSGFTVGYVADTSGTGATIPATAGGECPTNEILVINLGDADVPFSRGDCNGDGELNVTDGAISAQNIFLNRIRFFMCDNMLDANDDGQLDGSDPIMILSWVFLAAPDLADPFQTCGVDDDDDLTCEESNCQ